MRTAERGAVFLLAVYVTAMVLLLLGGVGLQRTMTEVRAAQVSADAQQAFYLAEGAVDQALAALKQDPDAALADPTRTVETASGTQRFTISKLYGNFSWQTATQEVLYHISGTGTANANTSATVTTIVGTQQEPLSGVIANSSIRTTYHGGNEDENESRHRSRVGPTTIEGDLRVPRGTRTLVQLAAGTTLKGNITVNPPETPGGYEQLVGYGSRAAVAMEQADAYSLELSPTPFLIPAATMEEGYTVSAAPTAMTSLPPAVAPEDCPDAAKQWNMVKHTPNGYGVYHLRDGDEHDLTPPGDGLVVACVGNVYIPRGAKAIVHDTAVVFVTGSQRFGGYGNYYDYGDGPYAFRNEGQLEVAGKIQQQPDRGFTVVATPPPAGRSTTLFMGDFEGSVYAPQSEVVLYATPAEVERMKEPSGWNNGPHGWYYDDEMDTPVGFTPSERQFRSVKSPKRQLGFVVGKHVRIGKVNLDFVHKQKKNAGAGGSDFIPEVLSWSQ